MTRVQGSGGPPTFRVPRRPVVLDPETWLGAEPWSQLPELPAFHLADGSGPPKRATRVRLCADDEALWIRFDSDSDAPRATLTQRDGPLWTEDVVEVFLAPGPDTPTEYFEFEVNPLGALFDARVSNPASDRARMTVDVRWNCEGILRRATVAEAVWSARLRIPWAPLGQGARPAMFRANFFRIDHPETEAPEHSAWSPTRTSPADFHKPAFFGTLLIDPA